MWLVQFLTCVMLGIILMTPALFFIGMCLYIDEMVADLRATLIELDAFSNVPTEKIIDEILFHNDLLEYKLVYVEYKIPFIYACHPILSILAHNSPLHPPV